MEILMPKAKRKRKKTHQSRLKVRKHRKIVTRFRGRRARGREIVSRVFSERRETRAISPSVAFKPFTTQQLPSRESTAIYRAEYDPKRNLLIVTFWGYKQRYVGSTYVYYGVSYDLWVRFMEASSKGRFFYYNIRTVFQYTRVK